MQIDNNINYTNSTVVVQEQRLPNYEIRLNRHSTESNESQRSVTISTIEFSEKSELNRKVSKFVSKGDKILIQLDGYIESFDDSLVAVKLENETTVIFPKILFKNINLLKFGKSIIYCIRQNEKGIRYQEFIEAEIVQTKEKAELLKLIDSI